MFLPPSTSEEREDKFLGIAKMLKRTGLDKDRNRVVVPLGGGLWEKQAKRGSMIECHYDEFEIRIYLWHSK